MKYFQADLVNFDENNIPYHVTTVFLKSEKTPTREEVEEFCREELNLDFEEAFTIRRLNEDEIMLEADGDTIYAI